MLEGTRMTPGNSHKMFIGNGLVCSEVGARNIFSFHLGPSKKQLRSTDPFTIEINVNGLVKHIDKIKLLLIEKNIHILAINETKLDETIEDNIISIDKYKLHRKDRNRHGGGVAIYIKEDINYTIRDDLPNHNLELICIRIQPFHSEPFDIISWYRPPNDLIEGFRHLERVLSFVDSKSKEIILLGDTNCNLMNIETVISHSHVQALENIYQQFGFSQIIREATRVTLTTSTLIDHIAASNKLNILESGVIKTTFSDHYLIYCTRKFRGAFIKEHKFIISRKMKNFDKEAFFRDVSTLPWDDIVRSLETLGENIDRFTETLMLLIEKHAPLQHRRVSQKYCPWLTPEYHKLRKTRDKLKKFAVKSKSTYIFLSYKHVRNKVNALNRKLKNEYYTKQINENLGNTKQTWKIINEIVNKTSKTTKIESIKIESEVISDNSKIPNLMNSYFCSIGETLKANVPHQQNPLIAGNYNVNPNNIIFHFKEITDELVFNACNHMKTSFGSGLDNISSFFIKLALPVIARPLAYLFNFSLQSGIFPDSWKTARVAPIYKEGSKEERSNYRPISVLPVLARLFENLVNKQLYDYLDKNKFIYRKQSGFRSLHSVVTCLLSNTNDWHFHLDQGMCTGIVLVDLKKAFDTVDHDILLEKLSHYGIKNTEHKWMVLIVFRE